MIKKRIFFSILSFLCSYGLFAQLDTVYTDAFERSNRMLIDGNQLYFSTKSISRFTISSIDISQSNPTATVHHSFNREISSMALYNGHVIFAQFFEGKISRFDPNNSQVGITDLVTGLSGVNGLALDSNWLYFSQSHQGYVHRVNLNNLGAPPQLVANGLAFPGPITIVGDTIYVSEISAHKVSKIPINPISTPIDFLFMQGRPIGLTAYKDTLYICNYDSNRIIKTRIKTGPPVASTVANSIFNPTDLLFVNNDMYIAEFGAGNILRIPNLVSTRSRYAFEKSHLYPNPANEAVYISNREKAIHYRLFDFQGKLLSQRKLHPNQAIDVSGLSKGIYFIQLEDSSIKRLVKN